MANFIMSIPFNKSQHDRGPSIGSFSSIIVTRLAFALSPFPITAMAFSPDGSQLLVGGYHEVTIWNTADGSLMRRIKNIGQRVHAIVFLADQKTIAIGCGEPGKNGEVRLVDFESGTLKGVVGRTNDVVFDVAVKPTAPGTTSPSTAPANEIAIAAADGIIRIVNTDTMVETKTIANHIIFSMI